MELKWIELYNCHTARLAGAFDLNVNWELKSKGAPEHPDGPYEVYACGLKCKRHARTVEEGKALAVRFTRVILRDALAALPE